MFQRCDLKMASTRPRSLTDSSQRCSKHKTALTCCRFCAGVCQRVAYLNLKAVSWKYVDAYQELYIGIVKILKSVDLVNSWE